MTAVRQTAIERSARPELLCRAGHEMRYANSRVAQAGAKFADSRF